MITDLDIPMPSPAEVRAAAEHDLRVHINTGAAFVFAAACGAEGRHYTRSPESATCPDCRQQYL